MVRLGLSDSMRSTVSIEDTEPLHTAAHRRSLRRPLAASTAAATDASSKQQTQSKAASSVNFNPLRIILGGILAVVLLSIGVRVLGASLRSWRSYTSHVGEQFERLEKNIALLEEDTTRLKTTADRFLQSCQEAQVEASTRTGMLQIVAKRNFDEQMTMQIQEHEQVMRDVLHYYAQQEQKVMKTRERLVKMNITLPVQMESLLAEKTLVQNGSDNHQLSLESNNRRKGVVHSSSYGSFFFYIVVICVSAVYLRNAIADSRKKELMEDKWSWSPVPNILSRLKMLLGSIVVIDDLRTPSNTDNTNSLEHIEHIELR